jgi:hypothetical protein
MAASIIAIMRLAAWIPLLTSAASIKGPKSMNIMQSLNCFSSDVNAQPTKPFNTISQRGFKLK